MTVSTLPKTEFPSSDVRRSSVIFAASRHDQSTSEIHRYIYVSCKDTFQTPRHDSAVSYFISEIYRWKFCHGHVLGDVDRLASFSLGLIKMPAPCCTFAMASCLCSLSNRKWPPLRCCCRLKAHRLARRLKPPFWSQRTESRQQRRERLKGGHGAEVRDSAVVVMAKEQWGRWPGGRKN